MRIIYCLLFLFLLGCDEPSESSVASRPSNSKESDALFLNDPARRSTPFIWPGMKNPKFVAAAEADLLDHMQIIGITVGDSARAYAVNDLSGMTTHVVNDVLEDSAVSVTYCNRTDIARVFANSESKTSMDLGVGGWQGNQMLITLDGKFFLQVANDIPLKEYSSTRTTWGEWKTLHPETTLCVTKEATVK